MARSVVATTLARRSRPGGRSPNQCARDGGERLRGASLARGRRARRSPPPRHHEGREEQEGTEGHRIVADHVAGVLPWALMPRPARADRPRREHVDGRFSFSRRGWPWRRRTPARARSPRRSAPPAHRSRRRARRTPSRQHIGAEEREHHAERRDHRQHRVAGVHEEDGAPTETAARAVRTKSPPRTPQHIAASHPLLMGPREEPERDGGRHELLQARPEGRRIPAARAVDQVEAAPGGRRGGVGVEPPGAGATEEEVET